MTTRDRSRPLRLMSWNIHGCRGADGVCDADRILRIVTDAAPDVLAVQEIETRVAGRGGHGIVALLAEAVGTHRAEAYTLIEADGHYGQAVFSRLPLLAHAVHDISWRAREPRRAIDVTLAAGGGRCRLIATHLGLAIRERRHQAARLVEALGARTDVPTVMMGDFNDWLPVAGVHRRLRRTLPVMTRRRTFPARFPIFPLDRIYASADCRLERTRTERSARYASDHLPIVADLMLPPPAAAMAAVSASSGRG